MGCICPGSSASPSYADYQDEEERTTEVRQPPPPPPPPPPEEDMEEPPAPAPENEFFNEIQRSVRPWELVSEFATKLQSVQQATCEGLVSNVHVQMPPSLEPRAPPRPSVLEKIKPVVVPK
jgi:hypothetical protein